MANELTFFLQKGQQRNHQTRRWYQNKNWSESIKQKKDEQLSLLVFSAEREGFEPPVPLSTAVFKTAVIDHSTTFPMLAFLVFKRVMRSLPQKRCKGRGYFWNMQAVFVFFVKKERFFSFPLPYETRIAYFLPIFGGIKHSIRSRGKPISISRHPTILTKQTCFSGFSLAIFK